MKGALRKRLLTHLTHASPHAPQPFASVTHLSRLSWSKHLPRSQPFVSFAHLSRLSWSKHLPRAPTFRVFRAPFASIVVQTPLLTRPNLSHLSRTFRVYRGPDTSPHAPQPFASFAHLSRLSWSKHLPRAPTFRVFRAPFASIMVQTPPPRPNLSRLSRTFRVYRGPNTSHAPQPFVSFAHLSRLSWSKHLPTRRSPFTRHADASAAPPPASTPRRQSVR
jgi:hypothetical protein